MAGEDGLVTETEAREPSYRRDIFPRNIVLYRKDLEEFRQLIGRRNEAAIELEMAAAIARRNKGDDSLPEDDTQLMDNIRILMPTQYDVEAANGNLLRDRGEIREGDFQFPDTLTSFYISNSSYAQAAIGKKPANAVDVFFSFERPSLKMDFMTLPSNKTENRSVINVYGSNEDWVTTTTQSIIDFLDNKKVRRPFIHASGTYDYMLYFVFFPLLIWLMAQIEVLGVFKWLDEHSIVINIVFGIYAMLFSLLFVRLAFQYVRWLFPPTEYYSEKRVGPILHRSIASLVLGSLILSALYDILKLIFAQFTGS